MTDKNEAARVNAANSLLDRGWGKAAQALEVSASGSIALEVQQHALTIQQLSREERALLRQLLEMRKAATAPPVIDMEKA